MRKVINLIRAALRALRRTVMVLRDGVLWPVRLVDAFLGGLVGGGADEVEEQIVEDAAGEQAAIHDATTEAAAQPTVPRVSLGLLAKRAGEMRDDGKPSVGLFDQNDPVHRHVQMWVETLPESGLRILRHATPGAIDRHLDVRDRYVCSGLPPFEIPSGMVEPKPAPSPVIVEPDKRKRRRIDPTASALDILRAARAEGRTPTLDDLVQPRQLAC